MRIEGLDTTNTWLAIIAIVSVIQILALGVAVWFMYRLYARAMTVMIEMETKYVVPLAARANHVLDQAQQITSRLKSVQETVADKLRTVVQTGGHAAAIVKTRSWPVVGVIRAAGAVISVLLNRRDVPRQRQTEVGGLSPASGSHRQRDMRAVG